MRDSVVTVFPIPHIHEQCAALPLVGEFRRLELVSVRTLGKNTG